MPIQVSFSLLHYLGVLKTIISWRAFIGKAIGAVIAALILCLASLNASAAPGDNNGKNTVELDPDQIDKLITTLESESARKDFIDNLKTLQETTRESAGEFSLSDTLHLGDASSEVIDRYTRSLNALGISDSLIGNILLILLAAIALMLFSYLNKRLAQSLNQRLAPTRRRFRLPDIRFGRIFQLQVLFGRLVAISLFIYTLYSVFPVWSESLTLTLNLDAAIEVIITLAMIILLAALVWELSNALLEYVTRNSGRLTDSRVETLLPVIRNIMLAIFSIIFALVLLSELGIDIVPLLAGAGVMGVALGFGAQALVQDFLTGIIVVFEDIFQVGDVIKVGDRVGIVERITLRKVQIRDLDGTVHTIPFSEVAVIDNYTKVFSYYLFEVGVAYREDVDEVIACLREIDEDMRKDDEYGKHILEPLEILGVDKFADSAVIIKARTKTAPMEKWYVGREFNRRMKIHFDANNIEIPFPHQTLYFGEDKQGKAPSASIKVVQDRSAGNRGEPD